MNWIIGYFLKRLIRDGQLRLIVNDKTMEFGNPATGPQVTLRFHDKNLLFKLVEDFTLHFGEAYMDGRLTIEQGTLHEVMQVFAMNYNTGPLMPWDFVADRLEPLQRLFTRPNSISSSRKNVAHHYDFSTEFFRLFLDKDLQYSCAYFESQDDDINTAQLNKKRLIASKLMLKKGMHVLDIGCGFGGLAIYLAKNFGVHVTGITLSKEQLETAVQRVRQEGLQQLVEFRLIDYREEKGSYDRIVSVGMFEHVGVNNYADFFNQVKRLLKDDGLALLHSIGRTGPPGTPDNWMDKYIFPGGNAPALSQVFPAVEKCGLWATDLQILQDHYAKTLEHWRANFERKREIVQKMYDERFCRMWEFYLIGAEMEFVYGSLMVFHLQLTKHRNIAPATRDYMFETMQSESNKFKAEQIAAALPAPSPQKSAMPATAPAPLASK